MYGHLLTPRRFRLPLFISRAYLPSINLLASVRMVSTKTIAVCDESSLNDGEMWVALITDDVSPSPLRTSLIRTLTRSAGKKSILAVERFYYPS